MSVVNRRIAAVLKSPAGGRAVPLFFGVELGEQVLDLSTKVTTQCCRRNPRNDYNRALHWRCLLHWLYGILYCASTVQHTVLQRTLIGPQSKIGLLALPSTT